MIDLPRGLTQTQAQAADAAALVAYDPSTGDEIAAIDTQIDVIGIELGHVHDETHAILHTVNHSTSIFPANTNLTCTFTALATANTFSAWAEIVDSGATKLSAAFALLPGHLTEFTIESLSEVDTIYMIEFAHGTPKIGLTSVRFAGGTKFQSPDNVQRIWGAQIPKGAKVYYQMKTATAVADTALINIRYHTET